MCCSRGTNIHTTQSPHVHQHRVAPRPPRLLQQRRNAPGRRRAAMHDRSRRAGGRPTAPAATSSGSATAAAAADDDAGVAAKKGRVAAVGGPGGVRAGGVRGGDELALLALLEPLEVGLCVWRFWMRIWG